MSAPMVRALLNTRPDGTAIDPELPIKTMTRRIIKPQPPTGFEPYPDFGECGPFSDGHYGFCDENGKEYFCPYGVIGDRLYVRESARVINVRGGSREIDIEYQADKLFKTVRYPERLAPAPKGKLLANGTYREASRICREITLVRVERLQDISEEDAKREGCELHTEYMPMKVGFNYRQSFGGLWESINGPGSWDANPWVWVVEFKGIEAGRKAA
jgi:hypothetical protein